MICPLCGFDLPDYARDCLQCHTPIAQPSADAKSDHDEAEQNDTNVRVERRRKARARGEGMVNRDRVATRRRETDQPRSPEPVPHVDPPPQRKPPAVIKPGSPQPASYRIAVSPRFEDDESSDEELPPTVRAVQSGESPSLSSVPPVMDRMSSQSGGQLNQLVDRLKRVIVSTTPEVQGRPVEEYKGVVSTGAVVKLEGWAPYLEGVKDIGSLRHAPFDAQIRKARDVLITDLKIEAAKLGANGVVGMTVQLHPVQQGTSGRLLWLVAIGTAVVLPE
jgi:uncharacterized protein YbjQ (UPF0145 family)